MRHKKNTRKLNRTTSHRRALMANMLKSLIDNERMVTTVAKAKILRGEAERMITMAKKNTLASRRQARARLMVRYNTLTPKEARAARGGDKSSYNVDRSVVAKLFEVLGPRFVARNGGYTRIVRTSECRRGDGSQKCLIEFLKE